MKKTMIALFFCILSAAFAANDVIDHAKKLAKDGKVDEALTLLNDQVKATPDDTDLHEQIQKILLRNGRRDEALSTYKTRYEQNPNGLNGYLYFKLLDKPSDQEKGYRAVIERDPQSVWGYYGLANALLDQDNLLQAIGEGKTGLDKVKEPAKLHYVLARIYRRNEDFSNAAKEMREYYKLDSTEDNRDIMKAYDWLEISHTDDQSEKFRLAQRYAENYKDVLLKDKSIDNASNLAEVGFVYADSNNDQPPFPTLVAFGSKSIAQTKMPADREERESFLRVKGALLALQAWEEAKTKHFSAAKQTLAAAQKTTGSEMYYYSALAQRLMNAKQAALHLALQAASYPPVYKGSKDLATELWKEVHSSEEGLEPALHEQRERFAPQRKSRLLAQIVSEQVPEFEMTTPDGKKISGKDLTGKIVLMNFWAVWCPPCREELPHWNAFYAAHKNDPGLIFAAVGDEPWETMQNYMKNQQYSFPLYRNEKYWEEFHVEGIPTMLMFDPSGKIRFRNTGFEEGMEYEEAILWQIDAVKNHKNTKS